MPIEEMNRRELASPYTPFGNSLKRPPPRHEVAVVVVVVVAAGVAEMARLKRNSRQVVLHRHGRQGLRRVVYVQTKREEDGALSR